MADDTGALAGVRVLDLAHGRAGSVATMLLADLGADVVRPEGRDGAHRRAPITEHVAACCWDRGKRRVLVDSLDPRADAALARLAARADVIVVEGGPMALASGGHDAGVLAVACPRAVIAWVAPNGVHAPIAELPDDTLLLAGASGFAQWQTATDDAPVPPVVPYLSHVHGVIAASSIVAALLERTASGTGQVVTTTGLHAAALMLATLNPRSLDRPMAYTSARDVRGSASFRLYRCADGRSFFLGALTPQIFLTALDAVDMVEVMVLPGMDGEFMNLYVGDNGRRVAEALEERFASQPRQHWLDVLAAAGVPAAAVQTRDEWRASEPYAMAVGDVERATPGAGTVRFAAPPLRLSASPMRIGEVPDVVASAAADATWADHPAATEAVPGPPVHGAPVAGLRVLDLSTFLAGPLAPTLLGQWGADVLKVEAPTGDPYRVYNVSYVAANQGKRRVVLDLTTEVGMATLAELVADADVVVDNFRPSLRAKLGLTTEWLHAANPRVVHATLNAFGDEGAWAEAPGFDPVIQACSGLMHACGGDDEPYYTSTPVHDVVTGTLLTLGVLAALHARLRLGIGQRVRASLAASSALVQCEELTSYEGRPPTPRGDAGAHGPSATHHFVRTVDGWVGVCAPGRADDPTLVALLDAAHASTADALVDACSALDAPAARVVERDEYERAPHLVAHGLVHVVQDDEMGRCLVVDQVATWSRSRPVDTVVAPTRAPEEPRWR